MMRRLYVGTMMASRQTGSQVENQIQSFTILASSLEEAHGAAYRMMGKMFPSAQGYGLSGKLAPQSRETVAEWLAAYDEQKDG